MAGVPAAITFSDTYSSNAQAAALMMSAQGAWNHTPTNGWACWTAAGSNAAYNANLAIDSYGADAISSYMDDFGPANTSVGHRRYLLYPQTQVMGTGDLPSQSGRVPANATWVLDGNYGGVRPPTRKLETAWPPAGFLPYQVAFRRWSFSYPGASFSSATVSMLSNGVPISVTKESVVNGYGENTLVWAPAGLNANTSGYRWSRPVADTVFTVNLINVLVRGNFSNFTYAVTIFDPDVAGPGEVFSTVSGPVNPIVEQDSEYSTRSIPYSTHYEWRVSQRYPLAFFDSADNDLTNFTASTSSGYVPILSGAGSAGSRAFHLAHPQPLTAESLKLKILLTPATNAMLLFKSRLGYSGSGEVARVQASTDQGNSWVNLYSQAGSGGAGETAFTNRTISLSSFVGRSVQIRFLYDFTGGNFYAVTNSTGGWFLDDIVLTNCWALVPIFGGMSPGTNFVFSLSSSTNHFVEARGIMFDQFGLSWGPGLEVMPVVPPHLTSTQRHGAFLDIEFVPGSFGGNNLHLYHAPSVSGPWFLDQTAVLKTNFSTGQLFFTTPIGANGNDFFRIKGQ